MKILVLTVTMKGNLPSYTQPKPRIFYEYSPLIEQVQGMYSHSGGSDKVQWRNRVFILLQSELAGWKTVHFADLITN